MRVMAILKKILEKSNLKSVHQNRKNAFRFTIEALLHGGRIGLTAIGRSAASIVAVKHNIKRVDRLLGNYKLHWEFFQFFKALTRTIITKDSRPVILVDWTDIRNSKFRALTAAVPIDGRALQIYCEVHPEKKRGNRKVHNEFIDSIAALLPMGCRPIIVTDAGFCNPWFYKLAEYDWDWIGRLGSAKVCTMSDLVWKTQEQLRQLATNRVKDLGSCQVARKDRTLRYRVIVGKKFIRNPNRGRIPRRRTDRGRGSQQNQKRARQPWVLATSLTKEDVNFVDGIYRKRMRIEESYRDTKNHRFGWSFEDARANTADRYRVLLLIATFAMLLVTLVGMVGEKQKWHHRYQANTVRKIRVLSLFYLGKQLLHRKECRTIKVSWLREMLKIIQTQLVV